MNAEAIFVAMLPEHLVLIGIVVLMALEIAPGRLQLVGQFPTRPQAVQFALVFQHVGGGWMIDEISLRVAAAETRPPPNPPIRSAATAPSYLPSPPPLRLR